MVEVEPPRCRGDFVTLWRKCSDAGEAFLLRAGVPAPDGRVGPGRPPGEPACGIERSAPDAPDSFSDPANARQQFINVAVRIDFSDLQAFSGVANSIGVGWTLALRVDQQSSGKIERRRVGE